MIACTSIYYHEKKKKWVYYSAGPDGSRNEKMFSSEKKANAYMESCSSSNLIREVKKTRSKKIRL